MVAAAIVTQVDRAWFERNAPDPRPLEERIAAGARQQQRRVLLAALPAGVLGGVVGFFLLRGRRTTHHEPPAALLVVALALLLLGVVVVAVSVVRNRSRLTANRTSVLLALPRRERREVVRQYTGRAPVEAVDVLFLRGQAEKLVAQAWVSRLYAGVVLIDVGNAVLNPGVLVLWAATALLFLGVAGYLLVLVTGARRFLSAHPAPATSLRSNA